MAFTPLNTTVPIKVYTSTGAGSVNLGTVVLALGDPTLNTSGAGLVGMCTAIQIQNQSGSDVIVTESAVATNGIVIGAGQLWAPPNDTNGNGYDVFELWLLFGAAGQVVSVFRRKA